MIQAVLRLFHSEDSGTVYTKSCGKWCRQRVSYQVKMSFKYRGNRQAFSGEKLIG